MIHEIPVEVDFAPDGHRRYSLHSVGTETHGVICECGWVHWLTKPFMLTKNKQAELVAAAVQAHVDEEQSKLNPTLADLTDWGWFDAEASV